MKSRKKKLYRVKNKGNVNGRVHKKDQEIAYEIGKYSFGPALYSFVYWVIEEAKCKNINKLYFLARDGYIMYLCAKEIISLTNSNIECSYLYCSRISLRVPSYVLMPYNEVLESVFLGGYQVTLDKIFDRVMLKEEEKVQLYNEQNLTIEDAKEILTQEYITKYKEMFSKSQILPKLIEKYSKPAYDRIIEYLIQEGIFNTGYTGHIGIVDSGWTGSMQNTLNILLRSRSYEKKIYGFYFGMYDKPQGVKKEQSEYLTYYFNEKSNILYKALFNNNVFEALCSAPHGMTLGYDINNSTEKIEPILAPFSKEDDLRICIRKGCESYFKEIKQVLSKDQVSKLLASLMSFPSKEEAEILGNLKFTDELTENQLDLLAPTMLEEDLKIYLVLNRISNFKNKDRFPALRVFWEQGSIVRSKSKRVKLYLYNIAVWNLIKNFKNNKYR